MRILEGQWEKNSAVKVGIIVSRFNQHISEALVRGACETLKRLGFDQDQIDVIWVPGAFEIPGTARRVFDQYDALIALGAVIRGETPHFEYVAGSVTGGLAELAALGVKPVIFGVLTCNTTEEAEARSGGKSGNKGSDAALAAAEMLSLYQTLSGA